MSEASLQIRVFLLLLVAVIVLVLLDNLLEEHASLIVFCPRLASENVP